MAHDEDERDDDRDEAEHEGGEGGHGEGDEHDAHDGHDGHDHHAHAAKPAPKPAVRFPEDALHASFEHAHQADLDAVPQREMGMWFTYTMIGIAVYGAVVIYWIYL